MVDEQDPVLFDAGTNDISSPDFRRAFDVIRRFNGEAERHAAVARPDAQHRRAAQNWLRLHQNTERHFNPIERAIPSTVTWAVTDDNPDDKLTLELFNRYCFRCHGTIKFNVFDKAEVVRRGPEVFDRLNPSQRERDLDHSYLMPPDRRLTDKEIEIIRSLIPNSGRR